MKKNSMLALLTATVLTSTPVIATPLSAHFSDGTFDNSNWQVSFENADGWSYSQTGSKLTVTGIDNTLVNHFGGPHWSTVKLSKNISALSDFDIDFDLSWDSSDGTDKDPLHSVQRVSVSFLDELNNRVASVFYYDSSQYYTGSQLAYIGEDFFNSGHSKLPSSGTASINLIRTGSEIDIFWDDSNIFSGENSSEVTQVTLEYGFYPNSWSYFGSESIDLGSQVNPVPVPAAVWFFGSALLCLTGLRKKSA